MEPWREMGKHRSTYGSGRGAVCVHRLVCVCGRLHLHVFIARVIVGPRKVWEKSQILHV